MKFEIELKQVALCECGTWEAHETTRKIWRLGVLPK